MNEIENEEDERDAAEKRGIFAQLAARSGFTEKQSIAGLKSKNAVSTKAAAIPTAKMSPTGLTGTDAQMAAALLGQAPPPAPQVSDLGLRPPVSAPTQVATEAQLERSDVEASELRKSPRELDRIAALEAQIDLEHPTYYTRGGIQVWDFLSAKQLPGSLWTAVKHICRAGHKPGQPALRDLEKARNYLRHELGWRQEHQVLKDYQVALPKDPKKPGRPMSVPANEVYPALFPLERGEIPVSKFLLDQNFSYTLALCVTVICQVGYWPGAGDTEKLEEAIQLLEKEMESLR